MAKVCPQCKEKKLRRMTATEIKDAILNWAAAKVPFDPQKAMICDECGYEQG